MKALLLVLMVLTLSASDLTVKWADKKPENLYIRKVCLDGYVFYYTDYRAPLTPKLVYGVSTSSNGIVTIISQTKCK